MANDCGCSNNSTTRNQCGDFEEPSNPDNGSVAPYRVKQSCGAPDLPEPACDEEFTTEYDPDNVDSPFKIIADLYDQACNLVLDQNSAAIITPLN